MGDMQREGTINCAIVGIAEHPAFGVDEARIGEIERHPLPAVRGHPAGGGHARLGFMVVHPPRHAPDHLHRDAPICGGQHQVLGGGDEILACGKPIFDGVRPHQPHPRLDRGVAIAQRGPCHAHHMSGRGDGGQIEMLTGQDRAILGPAPRDGHIGFARNLDHAPVGAKGGPAFGGAILARILGVHGFDIKVDIIEIGRGDPPCQPFRAARQDHRHAGDGGPDHAAGRKLEPRKIPDARRRQAKMWIIGQKRPGCGRARRCRGKGIGGTGQSPTQHIGMQRVARGGCGMRKPGQGRVEEILIAGQFGHACARGIGHQIGQTARIIQRQRQARAQHLFIVMAGQLKGHQECHGDAIGGAPWRDVWREQEEFRRAAPQRLLPHKAKPCVDASGVSLKRHCRVCVERCDRGAGQLVDIKAARQIVDLQSGRA